MKKLTSTKRPQRLLDPKSLTQVVGGDRTILFLVPPKEPVAK